ncbi:uroporphyrinogen-III C-methyltransferase [Euzebya tangerina]|uniref:uroporphyrinogen-III C-methyltransferase n=1 Tax=Euzebya tangerina TaxID=591198 RepID=UPI000E3206AB|nr:uroporphyrinogen-III C-methyltransferase [Euzebya tangerina]
MADPVRAATSTAAAAVLADLGGEPAAAGTVYLVGGGPGALGLVTARAATLLSTATFVAYDRLSPPEALAVCRDDAELVYVGKLPDRHALAQDEIDELLVDKAAEGHAVVRFKGGDPFVFGRGSEEAQRCVAAGIPFEVVPGITSAIAAPAYAGIPVTHRGISPAFAVITGHEDPTKPETQVDYPALAAFPGTLIFLMGVGRIGRIAQALMDAGRSGDTPVSMVRWGTTTRQEQLDGTLADIAAQVSETGFSSPAVTVVGEVAGLAAELSWFADRPLLGRSVLVPRTRSQASQLSRRLRALGADPVEAPTIAIQPTADPRALVEQVEWMRSGRFSWVAFTSANGVRAVLEVIADRGGDSRWFASTKIACVGSGTAAALEAVGLRADLVPETFTTRGLGEALGAVAAAEAHPVFLPRADIASDTLVAVLTAAGVALVEAEAYKTVPAEGLDPDVVTRLREGTFDAIALGSSSTARNLIDLLGELPHPDIAVISVGPVTSAACRDLGLTITAEADPHDMAGLAAAVVQALR